MPMQPTPSAWEPSIMCRLVDFPLYLLFLPENKLTTQLWTKRFRTYKDRSFIVKLPCQDRKFHDIPYLMPMCPPHNLPISPSGCKSSFLVKVEMVENLVLLHDTDIGVQLSLPWLFKRYPNTTIILIVCPSKYLIVEGTDHPLNHTPNTSPDGTWKT